MERAGRARIGDESVTEVIGEALLVGFVVVLAAGAALFFVLIGQHPDAPVAISASIIEMDTDGDNQADTISFRLVKSPQGPLAASEFTLRTTSTGGGTSAGYLDPGLSTVFGTAPDDALVAGHALYIPCTAPGTHDVVATLGKQVVWRGDADCDQARLL